MSASQNDFVRNNITVLLQKLHVIANITMPHTTIDVEPQHICPSHSVVCPFDLQIRPQPTLNPHPDAPQLCPYAGIGFDIVFAPPRPRPVPQSSAKKTRP